MTRARPTLALALVAAALAGCSDDAPTDDASARFDVREASVEPRDATLDDAPDDAPAAVDVTLVDVGTARDATAPADASTPGDVDPFCRQSAEAYATAVREAQSCMTDDDCQTTVCETLCCACRVRVNAASSVFGGVAEARERWRSYGCSGTIECPALPCEVDTGAVCSAEGRCVTLRGAAGDAGATDDAGDAGHDGGAP